MREGASGYEKPLLPLWETEGMGKESEHTDGNTDKQEGGKSGYPFIHHFKEVNLIKIVVMEMLRAW